LAYIVFENAHGSVLYFYWTMLVSWSYKLLCKRAGAIENEEKLNENSCTM
jgi:hypothetical protein